MSASNEWAEWHLTPRGWERGSFSPDFGKAEEKSRPKDAVTTYRFSSYQGSVFSKTEESLELLWTSDDNDAVSALRKKFGAPPKSI